MTAGVAYRVPAWALPGELAAFEGARPRRRTVRDWVVDAGLVGFAVVWWWLSWRDLASGRAPEYAELVADWMLAADPWVGAAACAAVALRRRFPLALAIAMVPVLNISGTGTGAVLVSLFTVAVHRGWLAATLVSAVQLAQVIAFALAWHPAEVPELAFTAFLCLIFLAPLAWGMVVRFRRQLLASLRRDAERERQDHARRLVEARRGERERIAREMHDVLAHRISLLSVHAGALAYRTAQAGAGAARGLTAEELAEAAQVIRDNAHLALTELGEVLSVLRGGDPEPAGRTPPPLLSDLPRLAEEAVAAGQRVSLDLADLPEPAPRPQEQRTVYRVVQEGLTNARKHAPGAPVAVRVAGDPGTGLEVTVTNPLPDGVVGPPVPGAGTGLTGLSERVALDGGTLDHGPAGGVFRLRARLPWPR